MRRLSLMLLSLLFAPVTHAQSGQGRAPDTSGLDDPSKEALEKTQKLLVDPAQREQAIKSDPIARQTQSQVQRVGGSPENIQKMYQMAAEIMAQITVQANGDPKKMQELTETAQKDPAAFLQGLSPEQQAQIRQLANNIAQKRQQEAVRTKP